MRVMNKPKDDRTNPEPGKTYRGTIVEAKFSSGKSKKDGKPWYGLTLSIKPTQADLYKVKAFDFVGEDETGYFVYADSKMETWIKRIMNLTSLETFRVDSLKDKSCLFIVDKSPGKPDPAKPGAPVRDFYNVTDILCLPIDAIVNQPAAAPAPAQTAAIAANTAQPVAAAVEKKTETAGWAEGEVL